MLYSHRRNTQLVYPGNQGGTNWYSPSFSPRTGLFYIPTWENSSTTYVKDEQPPEFHSNANFTGLFPKAGATNDDVYSAIRAIDPETGEKKWEYRLSAPNTEAGVLTTGSDLLFSGDRDGAFYALDARDGEASDYGSEDITLPDIPQANPSAADLRRDASDRAKLARIFNRRETPAAFTLPLSHPANPLPTEKSFGAKRSFNGKPAAQPHTGADYATPVGSPILAVADGTVVMGEEMFFEGNAVFIDHGDGLISMYFHLADINVTPGEEVKKGHVLGHVGSTGRATGPHLFFGIRWHDARIDPRFVLEAPSKIPEFQERSSESSLDRR
jgi:murein DD-endopeptidase MepM/ murein hydrolase activator NlpD